MVVHVDKIKICKGKTPESWIGEPEDRLVDRIEPGAFVNLFNDNVCTRNADIVNDIEIDLREEERRVRPKRNAPIPARYVQRIYAINITDVCCRDEGFGTDEVRDVVDDVESTDGQEPDRVDIAGRAFIAAHLHLQTPGEKEMTIGKSRGALRGMWMDMVPRFSEKKLPNPEATEPVSGEGFGGDAGIDGKPGRGFPRDYRRANGHGEWEGGQERGRPVNDVPGEPGRKGNGGCYRHGPFLGEMLPGQTLRMKRGMGGVAALAAVVPIEEDEDDADLADDVYAFIRKTPLPWTLTRIMQVGILEFKGVEAELLRATIAGVLTGMRKTAQHILMASIRTGNPHRGGRVATICLDTEVVDMYL